jgi:hypothetical protein
MDKKIFVALSIFAIVMIGCAYATEATDSSTKNTTRHN